MGFCSVIGIWLDIWDEAWRLHLAFMGQVMIDDKMVSWTGVVCQHLCIKRKDTQSVFQ